MIMQPFMSYKSSRERAKERRSIIYTILAALLLIVMTVLALEAKSIELYEEDENGNINQRNVGVFKSNSLVINPSADVRLIKRTRSVQPFNRIHIKIPVTVVYRESGPVRVEIEASQSMHLALRTDVAGGVLTVGSADVLVESFPIVYIYGKRLEGATVESAADASLEDISVNHFELRVRGSADVTVAGRATACSVDAQSASDIDLSALYCDRMSLAAFGATDIRLQVKESIEGRVQGAGDLEILGQPKQRELKVIGAYDVEYL